MFFHMVKVPEPADKPCALARGSMPAAFDAAAGNGGLVVHSGVLKICIVVRNGDHGIAQLS